MVDPHRDCFLDDNCGQPDCPVAPFVRRREEARRGQWSKMEAPTAQSHGYHTLDGRPISCGSILELQVLDYRDDDRGNYGAYLQEGRKVRYELEGGVPVLYGDLAGYDFTARLGAGMRFRWPKRD